MTKSGPDGRPRRDARRDGRGVRDLLRPGVAGADLVGQYLRPTERHLPVVRYWHPDEFKRAGVTRPTRSASTHRRRAARALQLPRRPARAAAAARPRAAGGVTDALQVGSAKALDMDVETAIRTRCTHKVYGSELVRVRLLDELSRARDGKAPEPQTTTTTTTTTTTATTEKATTTTETATAWSFVGGDRFGAATTITKR